MRFLILVLALGLAACGGDSASPPTPFYAYTPPATPGGMMCIDQCRQSHDYCAESCGLDYRACVNDVQAMADQAFDRYARQRFDAHLPVDKNPSDFENDGTCLTDKTSCLGDCDQPYNSCYKTCGGGIERLSAAPPCSFLCFE